MSKLDSQIRRGDDGVEFERDTAAALHFFDLAELEIQRLFVDLYENADDTLFAACEAAQKLSDTQPNSDFIIPERSPTAKGTGRDAKQEGVKQFPGDKYVSA